MNELHPRNLLQFWLWDSQQWMTACGVIVAVTGELSRQMNEYPNAARWLTLIGLVAAAFGRSLLKPGNNERTKIAERKRTGELPKEP